MITSEKLENATLDDNNLLLAARLVREHYYPKRSGTLLDWILVFAVKDLLRDHPPIRPEDLAQVIIKTPEITSQGHLSRYLAASIGTEAGRGRIDASSVFSGARQFSLSRISAMSVFLIDRGHGLCKTRLTKLLFYCDFVHYSLYGRSISGATYVRGLAGPELFGYERILKTMAFMGVVGRSADNEQVVEVRDDSLLDRLMILEFVTMQWVWSTYGPMTAGEITEHACRESVHRFTCLDNPIAYEYARMLQRLPDESVL